MLHKYPRTHHVEGSRLQPGDEDLAAVPFAALAGRHLVVEEKLDGANAAVSFTGDGELRLQSRGHFLTGGARERHFHLLKTWAGRHQQALRERLGAQLVMYGEWLYAKHTLFYDGLPHYFMEFDVLDSSDGSFLSTERRHDLLAGLPVASVPVLRRGPIGRLQELVALVGPSRYMTPRARQRLIELCGERSLDAERVLQETDATGLMEGLYLKHEEDGRVIGRYKWIRPSFLTAVVDSGSHWLARPIVPNQLAPGVDLFAGGDEG